MQIFFTTVYSLEYGLIDIYVIEYLVSQIFPVEAAKYIFGSTCTILKELRMQI